MSQRISEAEIKTVVFFLFKQKLKVYVPCIPFWFSHRKISKTWAEWKIKASKARQQDSLQNCSNLNIKDNLPTFKTISSFWVDLIANFQGCRNGYFVGKAMTLAEQKKKKLSFRKTSRLQASANLSLWLQFQSHTMFTFQVFLEPLKGAVWLPKNFNPAFPKDTFDCIPLHMVTCWN